MRSTAMLALGVAVLQMAVGAYGHAGHMHGEPGDLISERDYLKRFIGGNDLSLTMDGWKSINPEWSAEGSVSFYTYFYNNCSDRLSSGIQPNNVLLKQNSVAVPFMVTNGYLHQGACNPNATSTPPLVVVPSGQTANDSNIIWWHEYSSNAAGGITGAAANSIRVPLPGLNQLVGHLIIYEHVENETFPMTSKPLVCVDIKQTVETPGDDFYKSTAVVNCNMPPPMVMAPPPKAGSASAVAVSSGLTVLVAAVALVLSVLL